MKTLVIYYSFTGKSRKIAEDIAKKESANLVEIKERNKRSKLSAFLFGSLAARKQKQIEISPLNCNFSAHKRIIIVMPIWAGYPAPVLNNIINLLPKGKEIELVLTSASGSSKASTEKTKALIAAKGCKVIKYTDTKA